MGTEIPFRIEDKTITVDANSREPLPTIARRIRDLQPPPSVLFPLGGLFVILANSVPESVSDTVNALLNIGALFLAVIADYSIKLVVYAKAKGGGIGTGRARATISPSS